MNSASNCFCFLKVLILEISRDMGNCVKNCENLSMGNTKELLLGDSGHIPRLPGPGDRQALGRPMSFQL